MRLDVLGHVGSMTRPSTVTTRPLARSFPNGIQQDVRRTFGHTIRGHAKTLLRDHAAGQGWNI
jgi:hypothetical protein